MIEYQHQHKPPFMSLEIHNTYAPTNFFQYPSHIRPSHQMDKLVPRKSSETKSLPKKIEPSPNKTNQTTS
jgi:hypothetical protein